MRTRRLARALTWAILATTAFVDAASILRGGQLVPDTASYASCSSAWSSPIVAAAGCAAGRNGVEAVAIGSLLALVYLIWRFSRDTPLRGLAVAIVLVSGPWNDALGCAGADALGAALALALIRAHRNLLPAAAVGHLATGAAGLAARLTGGYLNLAPAVAIAATFEIAIARLNLIGSTWPTEYQWRYLLPAIALGVLPPRERDAAVGVPFEAIDAMDARRARYRRA